MLESSSRSQSIPRTTTKNSPPRNLFKIISSTRVALTGATGSLGPSILTALLDAGFSAIALTRRGGNASRLSPHPYLDIKEVDFTSAASLRSALSGVEDVVSCLATLAIGSQDHLIDASVAAGVKRFIPAGLGMDSMNGLCAQLPVCGPKVAVQNCLTHKSEETPSFTFTAIANGLFLDWGLKMGLVLDLVRHNATLYNGGDVPFSATNLADVAAAVLSVVRHQHETVNRVVYVLSALVTQNKLIQHVKDVVGEEWTTVVKDTEDIRRESLAELAKGPQADVDSAMLGFVSVAVFAATMVATSLTDWTTTFWVSRS